MREQQQNNNNVVIPHDTIQQYDMCLSCGYNRLDDIATLYQDSLCNVCFNKKNGGI